ncbi:MAG: hypothetical protein M0017_03270 [Desulfobacteraceae bacterium]|nr:hypothetical protein [Desulfobacteraceae bacterium]
MKNLRGKLSLLLLAAVYVLVSLRLFPGNWGRTLRETGWHLLTIAPYTVGSTIILAAVLRRLGEGRKVSRLLLFRIFVTVSIVLEFFLGIYDYVS